MPSPFAPGLSTDVGFRLLKPVGVALGDYRSFEHRWMRDERLLDLEGRHPYAAHLEHVVGAPAVDEAAILAEHVFVARPRPFSLEGRAALVALVPIAVRGEAPLTRSSPISPAGDLFHARRQAAAIAGHGNARCAVDDVAGPVRQEDVQQLCRAHAIQDIDAENLLPALADILWQRLASRDATAQPVDAFGLRPSNLATMAA